MGLLSSGFVVSDDFGYVFICHFCHVLVPLSSLPFIPLVLREHFDFYISALVSTPYIFFVLPYRMFKLF